MAEKLSPPPWQFVGQSYEARSRTFDCSRTVNLFPEVSDNGTGKNQQIAALYGTNGLRKVQQVGTGPIRCTYTIANAQLTYIVSGNEVYQLTAAEGTPVLIPGNLTTSFGPVQMSDNGTHALFVDGANGYTIDFAAPTVLTIVDPNFYDGAKSVTYQGGYFVLEVPNSSNFFISDLDSIDFLPLNESSAVSSPDILVDCISNNEQLYLLGARTIEVWALTGASASAPFQLIPSRVLPMGCSAPATVVKLGGTFFWLGANDQGDGVVFSMANDSPTRVSTHAIEYRIQKFGDLSSSTAYAYQEDGHQFYCLNLPGADTTYVFDMTTKNWHERQTLVDGVMERNIGQTHAFLNGEHIIGDYRNGNLYVTDNDWDFDDEYPIRRLRQTPHSAAGVNNVFYRALQVDIQPGVGSLTLNPRLVLRMSYDGGFTWGNPIFASMGKIGEYTTRARWQRLGMARDVVFQIYCDDPCKVVFLAAYLDVQLGNS